MGDPRRVTQELVEVEYTPANIRRVTQILVEVEYLDVPDESQTQVRGHDQIQPWSITSDRLSQEVAGQGLRGGGPEGPLWVDAAIYPQPAVQGQALVSDGIPQWTASLTPTWLGEHTFNAGLGIAAAQAITMGDEAYIGCGAADVRIVFDSGNDIALMGGNVGVGTLAAEAALHIAGGSGYDILLDNLGDLRWKNAGGAERLVMTYDAGNDLLIWNQGTDPDEDIYFGTKAVDGANIRLAIKDVGDIGVNTIDPDRLFHVEVADSATNSVAYAQRLSHITSNTAIAGFGVGLEFELEENDASNRVAAILKVKWSDAGETTNADGYFDFLTMLNDGAAASRMVVGYNGFVGINTAAPVYPLDVNGTVRTPIVHNAGAYDNQFAAGLLDAITVFGAYLDTRGRDFVGQEGWVSLIGDSRNVAASSGQIMLAQYDGAVWNRRLTIVKGGYVGVSTDLPDRLFHVEVADAATNSVTYALRLGHISSNPVVSGFGTGIEFELEENDGTNRVAAIIEAKWSDAGAVTNADGYLDFLTMLNDGAAASRVVVGYNGFVGVNNAAPARTVDVDGVIRISTAAPASPFTQERITVYNDGSNWFYLGYGSDADARIMYTRTASQQPLHFGGSSDYDNTGTFTPYVTFLGTGLVGIGTTIPDCLLDLKQTSYDFVHLDRTDNANVNTIYRIGVSFSAANDDYIYITTTGLTASQGMVLTDDGWLGKGTDAPFGPFHVTQSPGSGMFVIADDVDGGAVTIIPNAAGDVTVILTAIYAVSESGGGTAGGEVTVLNTSSVDLYDDGTDILTLAVAADGSATLQRTAGAATFDVSLWMVWL